MLLPEYHNVTLAANYTAAYKQCLRPQRKHILTAILLTISQILKWGTCIQKIELDKACL